MVDFTGVLAIKNILAAGLAVARKGEVCGSDVSHRVLLNAVQSELKQKSSVVKPGIRLL
jgi:hypothetical protein